MVSTAGQSMMFDLTTIYYKSQGKDGYVWNGCADP